MMIFIITLAAFTLFARSRRLDVTAFSFTATPLYYSSGRTTTRSFNSGVFTPRASSSDNEEGERLSEQERMAMVRQLQKSFYAPSSSKDEEEQQRVKIDQATGRILNLPLWRVGWVEVPGRTNCLNVHEGHYTNMFEKILSNPNPDEWWFGHLHLPGGTSNARSGKKRYELKDWKMEAQDDTRFDDEEQKERSAVIGCLMRIADYRRWEDGRLCLLVQAVDRFVVDEVLQSFPNGLANVQMLPDTDHVQLPGSSSSADDDDDDENKVVDENFAKIARASAVRRAFQCYDYECDRLPLPLPKDSEYMATDAVFGVEIAKQLPFCCYATDDSMLDDLEEDDSITKAASDDDDVATRFAGGDPRLEDRLMADLILRNPTPLPGVVQRETHNDADALETLLWLALEEMCRNYKFKLPPEIMCLMPPAMDYLDLKQQEEEQQPPRPLSGKYPVMRRQQRLSYSVPALIENTNIGAAIPARQMLLNTPTTRARLAAVLERIELMNEAVTGKFQ